jgi:LytS/YehU family sensor histidine kinase
VKAIRAQMNPHFIFNALNAIQHFITANDKPNALRFLSAFSKLVRLYLRYVDNDVIDLLQEISTIEQYLKLQRLRYDGWFDFSVTVVNPGGDDIKVPALITQLIIEEGVENLAKNKVAGKMNISVSVKDKRVEVTIDTAVAGKDINGKLVKRYENEYANWNDHIKLLKTINRYYIETKESVIRKINTTHHVVSVTLPCL